METLQKGARRSGQSIRGITLAELLFVLAIIATLFSLVLPSLNNWKKNIIYRQAARSIILVLREARSKAITTNYEHRVEFDTVSKMYRITQGNRANDSTEWNVVVREWTSLPSEVMVTINVPSMSIQMNTNGTANGGTIKILDLSANQKYSVVINHTGRIRTT